MNWNAPLRDMQMCGEGPHSKRVPFVQQDICVRQMQTNCRDCPDCVRSIVGTSRPQRLFVVVRFIVRIFVKVATT